MTALALLHYTTPPVAGGVESVLAAHARLLRQAGHDVLVVTGRGQGQVVPEIDSRHPMVQEVTRRLAAGAGVGDLFNELRDRLRDRLEPVLQDRAVVIAHNVLTMPYNLPLAAALGGLRRPVVAWTHDLAWVNPRHSSFQRPGEPYSILHRPQPFATYVAISRARQAELCTTLGLDPRAVPVVPNGIDVLGFQSIGPATSDLAARAGFATGRPLLLVPVRITRRKRIELALEAAALLRPAHPDLRLVVSGPLGPHSPGNAAYARELLLLRDRLGLGGVACFLFELAGPDGEHPVAESMLAELYRLADAILLPSESEGFGLPVLEAGLARVPIVCPDLPVLLEVAGGDAFTFAAGAGAGAVAAALEEALRASPARLRRRVIDLYGWGAVAERLEAVIGVAGGR